MATLIEFRAQYPQYDDIPDVALADALHQKFYADTPKIDFYKQIGLGAEGLIPGAERVITKPQAPAAVSAQDRIMGVLETPVALGAQFVGGVVAPIVGVGGSIASGEYGTQAGVQAGERAAEMARRQFYQPRTETARQVLGAIGGAIEPVVGGLPPTLGSLGGATNVLAPAAAIQTAAAARQARQPIQNVLAAMRQQPSMVGMGAAETAEQALREERLARFGIPATLGERTQSTAQQQFESMVKRAALPGIEEEAGAKMAQKMSAFEQSQRRAIAQNFERMTQEVGAEVADPTMVRRVGQIVDKALNAEYEKKFKDYKDLYKKADTAGETLQEVSYQPLMDYINAQTPTMRKKLDPILSSVSESLRMNDTAKTGNISIRALEDIYQEIGKVKDSPNAAKLKEIITDMGEGAGGEMYQAARQARRNLAKQFEDVARVDKLLTTRPGYKDRRVAFDDVYKHVILDGSLEEMRTVTSILKKSGPAGRKAYAELQGQTIQQMKDLLMGKSENGLKHDDGTSFRKLNTFINQLDTEDKLVYMFGKKGRDQIIDLRNAIKDVVVKQEGAVNFSGTSGAVAKGFNILAKIRFPGAKTAAQWAVTKEMAGKVTEALEQPNRLAPTMTILNAMTQGRP